MPPNLLKFVPSTVPTFDRPKAFSCFTQFSARGTFISLQIFWYFQEKFGPAWILRWNYWNIVKLSMNPFSWNFILATYNVLNCFSLVDTQSKRELLPNTVDLSKKYLFIHSNPWDLHCVLAFGINLYISRMSVLAIIAPCPAFITVSANFFAELIFNLSTPKGSTASLNENPFGADKLKIDRTFVFRTAAINGLMGLPKTLFLSILREGQWCACHFPLRILQFLFLPR